MVKVDFQVQVDIANRTHTTVRPEDVRRALQRAAAWLERQLHETVLDVLPEDDQVQYDVVVTGSRAE